MGTAVTVQIERADKEGNGEESLEKTKESNVMEVGER